MLNQPPTLDTSAAWDLFKWAITAIGGLHSTMLWWTNARISRNENVAARERREMREEYDRRWNEIKAENLRLWEAQNFLRLEIKDDMKGITQTLHDVRDSNREICDLLRARR